jgi:peptidoglycan/LPS O-acetylase OafA/YrhL
MVPKSAPEADPTRGGPLFQCKKRHTPGRRLVGLDGLRGLLAVYVLLGHMAPFAVLPVVVQSLVSHGGAAVDLFFVLSGLVIRYSLDSLGYRARPFLLARATRIAPVYLLVFGVAVLIQPMSCGFDIMPWLRWDNAAHSICVSGWPQFPVPEIVAHLTMTHGLFPQMVLPDVWISFLGAAWSLSTEWQFYLLALLHRDSDRLIRLLLGLAIAGAAWRLFGPIEWQFSRAFLPNQAHYFALGVASAGVVDQRLVQWRRFIVVLATTLLICAAHETTGKLLPPLAWTLCLAALRWPDRPALRFIDRVLRHPINRFLGAVSYSLYLVNEPLHKLIGPMIASAVDQDSFVFALVWVPAATGLPIAAAAALHRWLEVPAMQWGHRRAIRAAAQQAASLSLPSPPVRFVGHPRPRVSFGLGSPRRALYKAGNETSP